MRSALARGAFVTAATRIPKRDEPLCRRERRQFGAKKRFFALRQAFASRYGQMRKVAQHDIDARQPDEIQIVVPAIQHHFIFRQYLVPAREMKVFGIDQRAVDVEQYGLDRRQVKVGFFAQETPL